MLTAALDTARLGARAPLSADFAGRAAGRSGDVDGLRVLADAGNESAAEQLAGLLAQHSDLDGLRARADADDRFAARSLVGLLADRDDLDGLGVLADVGHGWAGPLADLLIKQGRGEEAERLRRFGLNPDGSIACS